MAGGGEVNFALLKRLADKAHPLLHIAADFEAQLHEVPPEWIGEVLVQARTVHHLLDLARVPRTVKDSAYSGDLDARAWRLLYAHQQLDERMARIAAWHCRETGDGGTVGDFCRECGHIWPCDTRAMADGAYRDGTD